MRKQRPKIRKEDIGDPSNFVHIQHAGFGPKLTAQRSFDLDRGHGPQDGIVPPGSDFPGENSYGNNLDEFSKVERRIKGSRNNSRIPRHHRSTTAGLFSENSQESRDSSQTVASLESPSPRVSESNGSSLKPTFGSLLNLSFLPLGLGKSSSKSTQVGKTKRMSLLNLTASNLFAAPKAVPEEKRESVHMTSYTRRRSFSSSVDGDEGTSSSNAPPTSRNEASESNSHMEKKKTITARVPLAKLGRSKSTMAEFSKRPKLRLVLPPAPPPPVPPHRNIHQEATLPSPPPTPEPSPPNTPSTAPVESSVILRPFPPPRSRIIPLPSTSSLDSGEPSSPQYLTPAGGCSPLANNTSPFPLLSPTLPPTSTPLFPTHRSPGTPPVWPLQPTWPSVMAMVHKEATIPELPSPLKEGMETNEYDPVVSIVDSYISEQIGNTQTTANLPRGESVCTEIEESYPSVHVASSDTELISTVLCDHIPYNEWPGVAQKLLSQPRTTSSENESESSASDGKSREIYRCLLTKTLELWTEMTGNHEITKRLADSLEDINYQQAADMLRQLNLQNDCDSQL